MLDERHPIVNFLICGAQKSGTTALYEILKSHPQIFMPNQKEIHFFDHEPYRPNYYGYHKHFSNVNKENLVGECTPIYMYWEPSPRRIWEYNPNMKIIVVLRNPIERAFSHWNMETQRGYENLSFMDAIDSESTRIREALPYQHRIFSYIDRGRYAPQIRRLFFYFCKENILVLRYDDFRNNPNDTLNKITDFLKIDVFQSFNKKEVHKTTYKSPLTGKIIDKLQKIFYYDIKQLEEFMEWDLSSWLNLKECNGLTEIEDSITT